MVYDIHRGLKLCKCNNLLTTQNDHRLSDQLQTISDNFWFKSLKFFTMLKNYFSFLKNVSVVTTFCLAGKCRQAATCLVKTKTRKNVADTGIFLFSTLGVSVSMFNTFAQKVMHVNK